MKFGTSGQIYYLPDGTFMASTGMVLPLSEAQKEFLIAKMGTNLVTNPKGYNVIFGVYIGGERKGGEVTVDEVASMQIRKIDDQKQLTVYEWSDGLWRPVSGPGKPFGVSWNGHIFNP